MRRAGEACYFYRTDAGFCLLENRCWSGKPCPKTQAEADRARELLCDIYIGMRPQPAARVPDDVQ